MNTEETTSAAMTPAETTRAESSPAALPASVQRLRRMQVRSVVVGIGGGLLFLIGLALTRYTLAWGGLVVFLAALVTVFLLGVASARASRRSWGS